MKRKSFMEGFKQPIPKVIYTANAGESGNLGLEVIDRRCVCALAAATGPLLPVATLSKKPPPFDHAGTTARWKQ